MLKGCCWSTGWLGARSKLLSSGREDQEQIVENLGCYTPRALDFSCGPWAATEGFTAEGGDGESHVHTDVNSTGLCRMRKRLAAVLGDSEHGPAVVCRGNKCVILPFSSCLSHPMEGLRERIPAPGGVTSVFCVLTGNNEGPLSHLASQELSSSLPFSAQ